MSLSRIAKIAVALFLVLTVSFSGAAGPAIADPDGAPDLTDNSDTVGQMQEPPGAGPGNSSNDSNVSAGSDDDAGEEEEDDEGGTSITDGLLDSTVDFVGGVIPDVPNVPTPAEATEQVWSYIAAQAHAGFTYLIDEVFNNMLGTPTINNDGPLGIMGAPEPIDSGEGTSDDTAADEYDVFASHLYTDLYNNVYMPYIMPLAASVLGLASIAVLIGPSLSAITHQRMLSILSAAIFAVILVVASWEFAALLHAMSDSATQHFLPDGDELVGEEAFADTDGTAGAGPLSVVVGFGIAGLSKGLILAIIHGVRHVTLFVFPLVLPFLLILAYFGVWQRVKLVGSVLIWQYYGLLVMNIPTAILLRIAYEAQWQFLPEGVSFFANFAASMGIFFVAIIIPLLISGSFLLIGLSMRGVAMGTAVGAAGAASGGRYGGGYRTGGRPIHQQRSFRHRVLGRDRSVAEGGVMLASAGVYYGGRKAVANGRRAGRWAKNKDAGRSSRALRRTGRKISTGARKTAAKARARVGNRTSGN